MSTTSLDTYEGQCARLDLEYVQHAGAVIAERLDSGDCAPIALSYQPDNGTAYALLLVPIGAIDQLSAEVNQPNGAWPVPSGGFYGDALPGRVLVVKCNDSDSDWAYVFDLRPRAVAHVDYVMGHTRSNLADASAITALFRAICGVEILP